MIGYCCVSDLHLGALNSMFDAPSRHVVPEPPLDVSECLADALQHFIEPQEPVERPRLILLGDTMDLQFSPRAAAAREAVRVPGDLASTGMLNDEIVATAGNHDHALWTDARISIQERLLFSSVDDPFADRPATAAFTPDPMTRSRVLDEVVRRSGFGSADLRYPNIGLATGANAVVPHHGHFHEEACRAVSRLRDHLVDEPRCRETVRSLAAENGGWIDFAWSALGDAGGTGEAAADLYRRMLTPTGFRHEIARWGARIAQAAADTVPATALQGLRRYLAGPTARQIAEEGHEGLSGLTYVSGHTHKAYMDRIAIRGRDRPVTIVNMGGWALNGPRLDNAEGAATALIDANGNTMTLRMFSTPRNGEMAPPRVEGFTHGCAKAKEFRRYPEGRLEVSYDDAPLDNARIRAAERFGLVFRWRLADLPCLLDEKAFLRDIAMGALSRLTKDRRDKLTAPEHHAPEVAPGRTIRLTRYRGGSRTPVIVANGFGARANAFAALVSATSFAGTLAATGRDVWLPDYRGSGGMPSSLKPFDLDAVAPADWPKVVETVCWVAGVAKVDVVAHCVGAMTATMALLAGETRIRRFVAPQLCAHAITGRANHAKADAGVARTMVRGVSPGLADALKTLGLPEDLWSAVRSGLEVVDPRSNMRGRSPSGLSEKADVALDGLIYRFPTLGPARCNSPTCRRIEFLFGPSFRHDNLDGATHAAMRHMFGPVSTTPFEHVARIVETGHPVGADGCERYRPHCDRLSRLPILLLAGARNREMLPEATLRSQAWLSEGGADVRRIVLPEYGHMDTFVGREAARDVFPLIVDFLDRGR